MLRDCIFEVYITNPELVRKVKNLHSRYKKDYKFVGLNDLVMMFDMHRDYPCVSVYKDTTSWYVIAVNDREICFQYASDDETKRIRMQYLEDHDSKYIVNLVNTLLDKVENEISNIIEDKLENYFEFLKSEFTE